MGSTRRAFTPEYKEQSVAFVIDGGRPVAEVARNIGVHEMTLGKWVKVAPDLRQQVNRTSRDVRFSYLHYCA
jgi:transposase